VITRVVRAVLLLLLLAVLGGGAYFIFGSTTRPLTPETGQAKPASGKHVGAWVDEVVFREESDPAKAVNMIEAEEIHTHAFGINDPELYRKIQSSPALRHEISYGSNTELTLNPVGPTFPKTGDLNPFHAPLIREAMNWLIDRNHIVEEIYRGLAVPKYLPLTSAFPDYARLADVARQIELRYAHDPARAKDVITGEMKKLAARLVNGKWHYRGKPVRLIFIIRSDDHRRREIGDYVSTLLEELGFVVERQYKTPTEASPIWIGSDPGEGRWHLYTGGWITLIVNRDQADNFDFYYTARGRPDPLWQAYKPDPKLDKVAERLNGRDYATLEERKQLLTEALTLALKESFRIWLVDAIYVWPRRKELLLAADLAGGISGAPLWPYTIRLAGRVGGRVNFASPSILTEPWNPVAGSNWIFDNMIMRATRDSPVLPDPFTGLYWPQRVKSADVYVQRGLPVSKTHDWVNLHFVPSIAVPGDVWIDWNHDSERLVTVAEKHPKGLSARTKTVIRYSDDLLETQWHDGTKMALADMVFSFILSFERANKKSPIFDQAALPAFETFIRLFRGVRIIEKNPLVVEVYSDQLYPDAELIAASRADDLYTSVPWHELALGMRAEGEKELAFSSSKASRLKVDWMSYIAGPSLAILERHLARSLEEGFIPYKNTLEEYVSREQAIERYEKLGAWRSKRGHFWVGNGPFYLHSVHPVEKIVVVRKSEFFTDPAEKWVRFVEPRIAEVELSGPRMIKIGSAAEFRVEVSFQGKPYPARDVDFVRFLVFNARGQLVDLANAEQAGEGVWKAKLTAKQSARLQAGSNRIEAVVVSRLVAMPSFKTFWFVTVGNGAS